MITLKKIDVFGQLLLIAGALIYTLVQGRNSFISCYYIVGGWQLVSFITHEIFRKKILVVVCRNFYGFFLVLSFTTLLVCTVLNLDDQLSLVLTGLFCFTPLMAIYYLLISFRELSIWQHRQFIQLR